MAGKSSIEWTEATWNPIVGCSIVSPGCTNCYAMKMAARIEAMAEKPNSFDKILNITPSGAHYAGTTKRSKAGAVWTGKVTLAPEKTLLAPLRWKKPRTIFVNSMGDLFHESIPDEWIDKIFAVMALSPQHTFQLLTKRAERMRDWCSKRFAEHSGERQYGTCASALHRALDWLRSHHADRGPISPHFPLLNVWLGVSCERQEEANQRIPHLLQTPAAVRFISAEPLLGPIDISDYLVETARTNRDWYLDWVIAGGESGPESRPMHPDWPRALRDACKESDVPFFFKQWGAWMPHRVVAGGDLGGDTRADRVRIVHPTGQSNVEVSLATGGRSTVPGSRYMARVGKKAAGRQLDGHLHSEFPSSERPFS